MAEAVRSPRVVAANSGKVKERRDVIPWQEDASPVVMRLKLFLTKDFFISKSRFNCT